jgi:hypothetical protein
METILNNRKNIEDILLKTLNNNFSKINEKINSQRTIADYTENFVRIGFLEYLKIKDIKIDIKKLEPKNEKSIEDMKYNDILFDIKSSLITNNKCKNLISPFVLLKNLEKMKNLIYIFSKYEKNNDKIIVKSINIRHFQELNFDNKKEISYTGTIGKGQLQFKKLSKTYNFNNIDNIKKIIIQESIKANDKAIKQKLKDNEFLLKLI